VLSPNGDHPDCHRTYEAIGLGVIPITELDPFLYRHLEEAPVVYQNTNWNVTWLEETLPEPDPDKLNRNLVFEEYWMEYVERIVGRELQWWDKQTSRKNRLVDFAEGNVTDFEHYRNCLSTRNEQQTDHVDNAEKWLGLLHFSFFTISYL